MSGRIPREFIDELLLRVDIVDLIDSHVPLKKAGANFIARCPFHNEKTPSFSVNPNKQFFHCFGCNASGNAISFLMDYNRLDFVEAVEELAAFAGLDVPRENQDKTVLNQASKDDALALYQLMERVALLYAEQFQSNAEGKRALQYLNARGITETSVQGFGLGYAPDDWRFLAGNFDQQALLAAGLLVSKEGGGQGYDRFRGRIMFPIRDKRARIVGFGGRVLDDSLPKYLNSPETVLFHKGKEVYGLYELLEIQPKPERILLVEGYMDVICLAQYGIHYAVAALGTAASHAHLDLLFKVAPELVFCFDGDKAGRAAAWRVMEAAFASLKDGRQIRVMLLPEQHDPDSLLREQGAAGFIERINSAETLSDYFFGQTQKGLNLATIEGRAQLVNKAKPYLDKLASGIYKDLMLSKLQELSDLRAVGNFSKPAKLNQHSKKRKQDVGFMSLVRWIIALLVQNPKLAKFVEQSDIEWQSLAFPGMDLFRQIVQLIHELQPINTAVLLEQYRGKPEEKTVKSLALLDLQLPEDGVEAQFADALKQLLVQVRLANIERLLEKEQSQGLDLQEKQLLRKMLTRK